jgi:hypothetical protein
MLQAKHVTGLIFRINMDAQWRKLQVIKFFQKVLPECNEPSRATCCAFSPT